MEYYDDYDNRELKEANGPSRQPKPPANNMAIVSMILGIFAILLLCMCIAFPVSILLGAGAVCLSIMSKKGGPFFRLCRGRAGSGNSGYCLRYNRVPLPDICKPATK